MLLSNYLLNENDIKDFELGIQKYKFNNYLNINNLDNVICIYLWILTFNNQRYKFYIGKTSNLLNRVNNYISPFQKSSPDDYKIHFAYNAFQEKSETTSLDLYFHKCEKAQLSSLEKKFIKFLNPYLNNGIDYDDSFIEIIKSAYQDIYTTDVYRQLIDNEVNNANNTIENQIINEVNKNNSINCKFQNTKGAGRIPGTWELVFNQPYCFKPNEEFVIHFQNESFKLIFNTKNSNYANGGRYRSSGVIADYCNQNHRLNPHVSVTLAWDETNNWYNVMF